MQVGEVTLWEHQVRAVEKFQEMSSCLIAYDKRGGKTMTALALVERLFEEGETGPVLIVSDKTSQWERDFSKIGIKPDRLHLVDRPRRVKFTQAIRAIGRFGNRDYYQIHWAGLAPMVEDLRKVNWLCIVGDELHAAKNRKSARTKALKKLKSRFKIGLTADPGDNLPQDIWSLLNWLYPRRYSSFWRWIRDRVECEEEWGRNGKYIKFGAPINVEEFQKELSEFYISLTLEEIDPGQIPIEYSERVVDMSPEQARAYHELVELQMARLDEELLVAGFPMVLAMRFQQLAQAMGKVEEHMEWKIKTRWKVSFDANGKKTRKKEKYRVQEPVTTVRQIWPCPKADELLKLLGEDDTPAIVFTQFRDVVGMVSELLTGEGISHVTVLGGDNVEEAERRFQEGEVRVIVGTTGMISESIELHRADLEVFLDSPWSPRVRGQAEGRAKAIGKRRQIRCVDIKTRDTVDYVRIDRVREKQEWQDLMLGRKRE